MHQVGSIFNHVTSGSHHLLGASCGVFFFFPRGYIYSLLGTYLYLPIWEKSNFYALFHLTIKSETITLLEE